MLSALGIGRRSVGECLAGTRFRIGHLEQNTETKIRQFAPSPGVAMRKQAFLALFTGIAFAIAFYFVVSGTKEATERKHPYDNIIQSSKTPEWRATVVAGILNSDETRRDLKISLEQAKQLDELFEQESVASKKLWDDWKKSETAKKGGLLRPFAADGTKELAIKTHQDALKLLTSEQKQRLKQLEYRALGWNFVHLDSVQRQLRLSTQQRWEFKELKIEEVHLRTTWRRLTKNKAPEEEIQETEAKLKELEERFLQILDDRQRKIRDELIGLPAAE